jgi:hypothetical protein
MEVFFTGEKQRLSATLLKPGQTFNPAFKQLKQKMFSPLGQFLHTLELTGQMRLHFPSQLPKQI